MCSKCKTNGKLISLTGKWRGLERTWSGQYVGNAAGLKAPVYVSMCAVVAEPCVTARWLARKIIIVVQQQVNSSEQLSPEVGRGRVRIEKCGKI